MVNFKKNSNCNMPKTSSEMHMHDMVMVFEIMGGGGKTPLAPLLNKPMDI